MSIATGVPNGARVGPAKLTISATSQKQIPPSISGLNLIMNPERNVGNPASKSMYGVTFCMLFA